MTLGSRNVASAYFRVGHLLGEQCRGLHAGAPERRSPATGSRPSSGAAGWVRSTAPTRRGSAARWHSRSSLRSSPRTFASASASCASRVSRHRSTTRTSSRSTRQARTTASSSSRCATSRAPTSPSVVAEGGALDPKRAVDLLSQIAEALDAAHEKGLVHRDVKPSNVLIAEAAGREHCYLADFGLTKRTGSLSGVSVAGEIVGTLEYVAPEQITGNALDERADVYSLGCVLYECLTGQSPFPRATDVALLWAHVHEEPTPPSQARPELPKELDTVLARALAKEPGRRYRSAGELLAATRSALRLVDVAPAATKMSRRSLAGAAALVLVVLAAVLAFVLTRGSGGLSTVSPNSVGVIDPKSNDLTAEVPVGVAPLAVTTGVGGVLGGEHRRQDALPHRPGRHGGTSRDDSASTTIPATSRSARAPLSSRSAPLAEIQTVNPEQNDAASPISALGEGVSCGAPYASITFGGGFAWFVCKVGELGRVNVRTGTAARIGLQAGLVESLELRAARVHRRRVRARLPVDRESRREQGRRGRPVDQYEAAGDHRRPEADGDRRRRRCALGHELRGRHGHADCDLRAGPDGA